MRKYASVQCDLHELNYINLLQARIAESRGYNDTVMKISS